MSELDAIQARADAATEGPWVINDREKVVRADDVWTGAIMFDRSGDTQREWVGDSLPDAEFIAHAREDVPKLVAALRAVEAVHHPVQFSAARFICGHCQYEPRTVISWPCPTVTAIREALNG